MNLINILNSFYNVPHMSNYKIPVSEWQPWTTRKNQHSIIESPLYGFEGIDNHHNGLDNFDKDSIAEYTIHSSILNNYLFEKFICACDGVEIYDNVQEIRALTISNAIKNATPFRFGGVVYSGLHSSITNGFFNENDRIFRVPKFLSTTLLIDVAQRFATHDEFGNSHILRLTVPDMYGSGIFLGHLSHKPYEMEYLIDRDCIVSISDMNFGKLNENGGNTYIWHGKILKNK